MLQTKGTKARLLAGLTILSLLLQGLALTPPSATLASETPNPSSVTVAGDLQSESGLRRRLGRRLRGHAPDL